MAVNCLTGDAIEQVQAYVQEDRVNLADLTVLIAIIETAFGNPNHLAEAEQKLATIQQGIQDFQPIMQNFNDMLQRLPGEK